MGRRNSQPGFQLSGPNDLAIRLASEFPPQPVERKAEPEIVVFQQQTGPRPADDIGVCPMFKMLRNLSVPHKLAIIMMTVTGIYTLAAGLFGVVLTNFIQFCVILPL